MLLSSSNRKYPPFPLLSFFSWLCAWDVCYIIFLSLIAYTFRENREFVFIIIVQFMMSANIRIRFGLQIVHLCFVQYTISLSSLCKLIWRHWTYKMPVRYILSSVWVRLSIFSPLSIIQYVGLYVFSLPISLVMIEIIYKLCLIIIIKSEVWTITQVMKQWCPLYVFLYSYVWIILFPYMVVAHTKYWSCSKSSERCR